MNGTIRYTIRPYDSIFMLARLFNTTVDSIMQLNPGIEPENLQIGHVITIAPGFQYSPYGFDHGSDNINNNRNPMDNGYMNRNPMNNGYMSRNPMDNGYYNRNRMNYGNTNRCLMDERAVSRNEMDLINYMRMLWEQHVTWTIMAVMGILYNIPGRDLIMQRLLRNPNDFAKVLEGFYGEKAGRDFADLITDHINIAAELVRDAKEGNMEAYTAAEKRWYDNADQIAALMANINPNWKEDDWSAMLHEHLNLLSTNIADMIAENYAKSIENYDDIKMQALEMADMMAEGITR
jgi:hypothetical protein